jgi:ribosome biogenesis protein BRX1
MFIEVELLKPKFFIFKMKRQFITQEHDGEAETDSECSDTPMQGKKALLKRQSSVEKPKSQQQQPVLKNKQRVLLISSRGITYRFRHLLNDIHDLLPHSKKDSKLDVKTQLNTLNELAELSNCNNCIYFEVRKHSDLFMWMSKTPNGPSVKFHLQNIHTMDELKMTGNCLKGSRPFLSFDKSFDDQPHMQLLKEMFIQVNFFQGFK